MERLLGFSKARSSPTQIKQVTKEPYAANWPYPTIKNDLMHLVRWVLVDHACLRWFDSLLHRWLVQFRPLIQLERNISQLLVYPISQTKPQLDKRLAIVQTSKCWDGWARDGHVQSAALIPDTIAPYVHNEPFITRSGPIKSSNSNHTALVKLEASCQS